MRTVAGSDFGHVVAPHFHNKLAAPLLYCLLQLLPLLLQVLPAERFSHTCHTHGIEARRHASRVQGSALCCAGEQACSLDASTAGEMISPWRCICAARRACNLDVRSRQEFAMASPAA